MVSPHQIYTQLLRQVYRNHSKNFIIHCVYVVIFGAYLWIEAPNQILQIWILIATAAGLWHWHIGYKTLRHLREDALTGRNIRSDIIAAMLTGLGFGLSALMLPYLSISNKLFVISMLGAIAVSRLPQLSAVTLIYDLFLIGLFSPAIVILALSWGSPESNMLMTILLMFVSLYYSARQLYRDLMDGLLSRFGLENAAGEDKLTKLANRRRFDLILEQEWSRAKRASTPISLIMIDVDYFKKFNDFYGHQEGDECLAQIAKVLSHSVKRAIDLVARYGGEEFVILLSQTTHDDAFKLCEQIRNAVENLGIPHKDSPKKCVTISLGGVTVYAQESMHATELVKMADEALYQAKALGRNTVAWYSKN